MQKKLLAVALLVAFVLAIVIYKHLKKIVVLQFLLALMVVIMFIPKFYSYTQQTDDWIKQPDDIENVEFKNLPNIYLIQPDGYANFSELKNEVYRFDNSQFESFLNDKGFEFYEGFRSNYSSTIYTNSAIFGMKHHFYSFQENKNNHDFRKFIVSENPVLSIFKANSYKTHLLVEEPYFLLNRPKIGYDYTNIALGDIPYFTNGFDMNMPIELELESLIKQNKNSKNFYFLEKILPAHIVVPETSSRGVEGEREFYLEKLVKANQWLTQVVNTITSNDPNGLIVICADHGGFVGFKSTSNSNGKTEDRDLLHSVFSSVLAVKWPDNQAPNYDEDLKTSVNLFRVLFSYLSEDEKYLEYLQSNKSYLRITKDAPGGIYEVVDNNGNVVFNKVSN
ncbi:MAG: hypothetical protein V7719_17115 [Psychroserpens sp.]|uniref:hypothetical protein n=1 Tax=Psychroserpens sp. TaxID=2020870 RepID=UPI00300166A5